MKRPANIFDEAAEAKAVLDNALEFFKSYMLEKGREIASYLRIHKGIELDPAAIDATVERPYTILPINEDEAWLISWKGIRMPIMGWVVAHEPAFIKSKISRSMKWFTPFPKWIDDEMGWKPPEHTAVIDGTNQGIRITSGDEALFKKKYGAFLGSKQGSGEYAIRGGDAWIKLVSSLIRDGILPYQPKPIAPEHWNSKEKISPKLLEILETLEWKKKRPYLERAVEQWKQEGATTFNLPPGSGKSLIFQLILTYFVGEVLLFADTTNLIQQWAHDLAERVPGAKVTLSTYQGAEKHRTKKWDLILFDEAHRVPANSFSKLAFFETHYRAGATGTAWREDQRQPLIVALCGRPFYIPWEELIAADILRKPRIRVVTVPNEAAKITYTKMLLSNRKGRSWIYCDWIDRGKAIAESLKVPFIYGETSNGLQKIKESEICVVSRVADKGISLRDLRLVIEVAGQGKSREQFGQRVGRLLHGQFEGEFYTLFTEDEIRKYRSRIFGVEAELGGQVEIEFLEMGSIKDAPGAVRRSAKRPRPLDRPVQAKPAKPLDEIGKILAIPSVAAKIQMAERSASVRGKRLIKKVIRYCWETPLSPRDIAEGLGNTGSAFLKDAKNACLSNVKAGLMQENKGLYFVDRAALKRLETLNSLRNK